MDIVQPIVYHIHLISQIQLTLAHIIMNLPGRVTNNNITRIPRPRPTPIQDLFQYSEHCPYFVDNRVACLRCRTHVTARDTSLVKYWLSKPCIAVGSFLEKPMPLSYGTIIGKSEIDPSHKPYIYKGLIYCHTCSTHSGTGRVIRHLSKPCSPITTTGKATRTAILEDRLPGKLT